MSQVLYDDDDGAAAADDDDNNNHNNNGWPVRMWADADLIGGLDSCGRAFTAHPEGLSLTLVEREVEIIFIHSSCLTENIPLSITKANLVMLCIGLASCLF